MQLDYFVFGFLIVGCHDFKHLQAGELDLGHPFPFFYDLIAFRVGFGLVNLDEAPLPADLLMAVDQLRPA